MQVILQENIPSLGNKLDIKNVKDGHARNFLIPRGLVVLASKSALKNLELRKLKLEKEEEKTRIESEKQAKKILKEKLNFKVLHNKGKAFGSITTKDIYSELKEKGYSNFEIILGESIKTLGE